MGIYEIQLVCIMCMGLNMRYSGHKRVKKYQSIHLAPPQLLLKVLVYLALIHFSRKYSFLKYTHFNINLAGYFIICHPKKAPPPNPRPDPPKAESQLPHLIWDAIIQYLSDIQYIHIRTNILTSICTSIRVGS